VLVGCGLVLGLVSVLVISFVATKGGLLACLIREGILVLF
jgi:hypothetical protein